MKGIEARQTGAALFCALSAPAATLLASLPPWSVVPAAAIAALWWAVPVGEGAETWRPGVLTTAARLGVLLLSLAVLAVGVQLGGAAYPTASNGWILGVLLLGIAMWAASRGKEVILRTGAILFWFLLLIYAAIGAFSARSISPRAVSSMAGGERLWPLALLWLPMANFWAEKPARPAWPWRCGWMAISVGPCLLCCLILGPTLTAHDSFALYTLTKSVSILDILERFEVLLSAAVTAGGFCLMGWMAHILLHQWQTAAAGRWKSAAPVLAFFAACGLSRLHMKWLGFGILLLGTIFWAIIPVTAQFLASVKKSKKI